MSLGSILCEYNNELKKKAKEKEISKRILTLKQRNSNLDQTRTAVIQEISTGERTDHPADEDLENRELSQLEIENLFNISKAKQKLECYAYMTGITAWKQENNEIHFIFDPYIRGNPKGPYVLKMKPKQDRLVLKGHTLPHAVPVRKLYGQYIADTSKDAGKTLSTLLKAIFRYLRGFLSREDQVEELMRDEELKDYIKEIQAVKHYTHVQLMIEIRQTGENATSLRVTISMSYEKDGERPVIGSIKVNTDMDVDTDALLEQCAAFYTERLKEAVIQAF